MIYIRPPAHDIDAWAKLGSPGWDWPHYHAAMKKAETYVFNPHQRDLPSQAVMYPSLHPPTKEDIENCNLVFNPASFGTDG